MKTTILILSICALSFFAKSQNYSPYKYDGHSVNIDIHHVFEQVDIAFVDTLKKYHLGGMEAGRKVKLEAIRVFGGSRFNAIAMYLDQDTMLNYGFALLQSTHVTEQSEFIAKLYWEAHPVNYVEILDNMIIGWNNNNGLNCGKIRGFDEVDSLVLIQKKHGDYVSIDPKSIRLATDEEINNYY